MSDDKRGEKLVPEQYYTTPCHVTVRPLSRHVSSAVLRVSDGDFHLHRTSPLAVSDL